MNRPTDEMTGRVMAFAYFSTYDPEVSYADIFDESSSRYTTDPRDDTDAALELLHWLINNASCFTGLSARPNHWRLEGPWGLKGEADMVGHIELPISGQPFRYEIVALAIKVMEMKE